MVDSGISGDMLVVWSKEFSIINEAEGAHMTNFSYYFMFNFGSRGGQGARVVLHGKITEVFVEPE